LVVGHHQQQKTARNIAIAIVKFFLVFFLYFSESLRVNLQQTQVLHKQIRKLKLQKN
jgi:hypothetical protein